MNPRLKIIVGTTLFAIPVISLTLLAPFLFYSIMGLIAGSITIVVMMYGYQLVEQGIEEAKQ